LKKKLFATILVTVLSISALSGCGKASAESTSTEALKTKYCGNFTVSYNDSKFELISGETTTKKVLTMADISSGEAEGISIMITADYSLLDGVAFPTSVRSVKKLLLGTSYGDNKNYYENDNYYIETEDGYATDGNYSYFTMYVVPKESANENAVYIIKVVYGVTYYPSNALFNLCMDSAGNLIGQNLSLDYQETMDNLKDIYDDVNGDAYMTYDHSKDDAQTYEPKLMQGMYTLSGEDFSYIDVGTDSNTLQAGTYTIQWVSGSGTFNHCNYNLVSVEAYEIKKNFEDTTITLQEGDRIYLGENVTINLVQE